MKFLVTESQFELVVSDIENHFINEGINDEAALRIIKISGVDNGEKIFNYLKQIDKSKNHKSLPAMVTFYLNHPENVSDEYFNEVIQTFKKLSNQPNSPDVTITKDGKINILNNSFEIKEFEKFKDFVDHYYYKENEEDAEVSKKLLSTEENIIFENDKFIVYEAPSPQVCIKLFGKDNEGRKYVERSFCIGAGTLEAPTHWYAQHRDPSGSWRVTFYVVVDKEKFKVWEEHGGDSNTLLVVIGVRRDVDGNLEFLAWDKENSGPGDRVNGFESPKKYVEYLVDNGVNIKGMTPKPFIDLSDSQIVRMAERWSDDDLFDSLTPKQKYKYVNEKAHTLTEYQVKFLMKYMPPALITNFIKNFEKVGTLQMPAFLQLTNNLKKSYINSKLIQLYNNNNKFNEDMLFKYIGTSDDFKTYAINHIKNSLSPDTKHINNDKESSKRILSLLDPISFFESLVNEKTVDIDSNNFKMSKLPENIGDYLSNVHELNIKNLDSISSIPASIGKCKNLTILHIWNCHSLNSLPDEIGQLSNLNDLVVKDCYLTSIPETIGKLTNVETISLEDNQITSLPKSISNCRSLHMLKLDDNQISNIPKSIFIKEGVPLEDENGETNTDAIHHPQLGFISLDNNPLNEDTIELLSTIENLFGFIVSFDN